MKRILDVLIILIFLTILGVGGYFGYTQFLQEDDSAADDGSGSGAATTAAGIELPTLPAPQIAALLPGPPDLPPELGSAIGTSYQADLSSTQEELNLSWPQAGTKLATLRSTYGWNTGTGIQFDTCALDQGVSLIKTEITQLGTSEIARAFVDDPQVRGFFRALSMQPDDADGVHGFTLRSITPDETLTTCYAGGEYINYLYFEHWGLLVTIQVNTSAAASANLGHNVAYTLADAIVTNIDTMPMLSDTTIPPTPVPEPLAFERYLTADVTADQLSRLMPTISEWEIPGSYSTDLDESMSFWFQELVAYYREPDIPALNTLAATIDRKGRRYGLIAESIRVWKPTTACPDGPVRLEMNMMLFERPAGAQAYMLDDELHSALTGTPLYDQVLPSGDSTYVTGTVDHDCGTMQVVQKTVTYERLLFSLSIFTYPTVDQAELISELDAMLEISLIDLYMKRLG